MRQLSRRELLKAGVATAVLARTARAAASPVYLIRTLDRQEGIRRGLAALGMPAAGGKRVVIKPNFNSADEFPASTHLDTVKALVRHFQTAGAAEIGLADRSGMGNTRRVMEQKGVPDGSSTRNKSPGRSSSAWGPAGRSRLISSPTIRRAGRSVTGFASF